MDAKTLARFWAKVDVAGPDDCWLWTASRSNANRPYEKRYGQFCVDGKVERAHRVSYMIAYGDYPAGDLLALHDCHNPPCVNPAHLHPGTHADNSDEKMAAGRHRATVGENHGVAKLTEIKVLSIRALYAEGISQTALGRIYGMSQTMISLIVRRKNWRHI